MRRDEKPIIVEQAFDADINAVWDALTKIDLMRQWYFDDIPDFKPEVGFETQFTVTNEGRDFPHMWKVIEAIPAKKIAYSWKYDTYPGDSFVEFELFERDDSTKLKLTVHVLDDFPDDIPEFKRESCVAGWEYFIKQRLREFLEKTPLP